MWIIVYIAAFILSAVMSILFTRLAGKAARKFDVLDIPSSRKVHRKPTPLLGGLGIYASMLITIISAVIIVKCGLTPAFLQDYLPGIHEKTVQLSIILLGGLVVIAFGLADDIRGLTPGQKLLMQTVTAVIVFAGGIRVSFFLTGPLQSFILTVLWFLLMMNSFNLMDNMDGLSAGVAFISGTILFAFAVQMEQLFVATLLSVFLGSILGFLRYNFPPAKIFMGECGSSFLGYFLGTSIILITFYKYEETQTFLPLFAPIVIFSVLFFDTLSVIWIRKARKLPVFKADKNHLSHRLVSLGMSKKQAVLFIYLLTLCTGMGALLLGSLNSFGGMIIIFNVAIMLVIVGILELTGRTREEEPGRKTEHNSPQAEGNNHGKENMGGN